MPEEGNFHRITLEDNWTTTHFRPSIPSFHPGPPTQLISLRSQYDTYPVPEYENNMVQHPNPYIEYIYRNVSEPSVFVGPFDFGQRPPQYYYPSSNILISPQFRQHSVSPLIPGSSSTHYVSNFDQQVCHGLSWPLEIPLN
jgi:hypothetical protein